MILRDRLKFVLVAPSHPGNIGSAARAIKVMGFHRLAVVCPREVDPGEHSIGNIIAQSIRKRRLPTLQGKDESRQNDETNCQPQRDIRSAEPFTETPGPRRAHLMD